MSENRKIITLPLARKVVVAERKWNGPVSNHILKEQLNFFLLGRRSLRKIDLFYCQTSYIPYQVLK